jgi:hypothetical protein
LQPSEIEALPYYEYFYYVKNLVDHLKEQDKQQKKEQAHYDEQSANMQAQTKSSMPKMPSMGNMGSMKAPSVKMPKL